MISVDSSNLSNVIERLNDADIILIDMNDTTNDDICCNVLYLLEPSIIMLNKLVKKDKNIFSKLKGSRIILNKSFLDDKAIYDLEKEAGAKFFYNIPPLDDRKKNSTVFTEFFSKLGFNNFKKNNKVNNEKIIGLFKK